MVISTNIMTNITRVVMLLAFLVTIVVSIIGAVKAHKIKKARRAKLGYHSLTRVAQVEILKKKAEKMFKKGCIPTGLNDLYQDLSRDSAVGYAKYLNRLSKKHKKRIHFYNKKRVDVDKFASNQIMHSVSIFYKSHLKLFAVTGKPKTERVY